MNKDYNILKKYYGEKFAQLCRGLFPTLLEQEGLLSNIILSKYAPSHHLYDDIIEERNEEGFKNYIYCFVNVEKEDIETNKSVKELLSDAGYNFYECKSEEDIQSFKKYYVKGEELCTFNGGRLNRCLVFWAVKKDVDQIRREDFENPTREDEYGTSVISIQFTRQGHTLSIKNRYNHRVNNPDATFNNNLDNIIPGLTNAFERECGFKINQNNSVRFKLPNYVLADDGKWYKYNYEINNIYYCPDNIIIDNGQVKQYDRSRYIIIDYFITDMKEKTIKLYDKNIGDCFPDSFINIEKIQIIKTTKGKKIVIQVTGKEDVTIEIDELNRIVSIDDKNITKIKDNYLYYSNLKELNLPNLEIVGGNFLSWNLCLTKLDLPNLKVAGNYFLWKNETISEVNLPNLEEVKEAFMPHNKFLTKLDLPNLKAIKSSYCHDFGFLFHNTVLEEINMPILEEIDGNFLTNNNSLTKLDLPNLKEIGDYFLNNNEIISEIYMPNIESIGGYFMSSNLSLTKIDLPNLKIVYGNFLESNQNIEEVNLPNLEIVGGSFLPNNIRLKRISLPKLKKTFYGFLEKNMILEEIKLPNIKKEYLFYIKNKNIISIINKRKFKKK